MFLKNILTMLLTVMVFVMALTAGCAHTGTGFGYLMKATGSATMSLGTGVGKLLNGIGEDVIDASSKQLEHSKNNQ